MKKHSVGFEWSYRDLLFTMMIAFMAMSVMALIISSKNVEANSINQGNIIIELFWSRDTTADIDLWVQAPNEKSVGYPRKSGITFNLLRDDLGKSIDPESRNQELVVGRSLKSGEYIVNIHWYSGSTAIPVECTVIVSLHRDGKTNVIIKEKTILTKVGEETTIVRFSLDKEGNYFLKSFNKVFKSLRSE